MAVTEDNQICRLVLMLQRNQTPFLQPQHRHGLEGMHQCFRGICSPNCHILWWWGLQYMFIGWYSSHRSRMLQFMFFKYCRHY